MMISHFNNPTFQPASILGAGKILPKGFLYMKWHKKMTDHLDDPFVQELIYKFGANGYMVYFGIISLICRENKKELTGKATFPSRYLKEKLHISVRKVEEILRFCQGKGKLSFNSREKNFNFDFPKILEIKDNHSYNFKVASKSLQSPNKEVEVEVEVEKDIENSNEFPPAKIPKKLSKANPTIVDFYHDKFLEKFGVKPDINGGKDGKILNDLVGKYGEQKVKDLIAQFLNSDDQFIAQAGWTVGVFKTQVNKLLVGKAKKTYVMSF